MSENKLRGEVYYPTKETTKKAQVKDRKLSLWISFPKHVAVK